MPDWIIREEAGFSEQVQKWMVLIRSSGFRAQFNWNDDECNQLAALIVRFAEARHEYKKVDSTVNRIAKDEAKEELWKAMRMFANTSIRYNRFMDEPFKREMGICSRGKPRISHARPASHPQTIAENTVNHFEHRVRAVNQENTSTAKPDCSYSIRYAWKVGGERPAWGAELPNARFSRRTSLVITFTEREKGLPVWYATCYENAKGESGPWSPVIEAYIA